MNTIFSFNSNTKYCFTLLNGKDIRGYVYQVFEDGIMVNQMNTYIPQASILYWFEIE